MRDEVISPKPADVLEPGRSVLRELLRQKLCIEALDEAQQYQLKYKTLKVRLATTRNSMCQLLIRQAGGYESRGAARYVNSEQQQIANSLKQELAGMTGDDIAAVAAAEPAEPWQNKSIRGFGR